MSRRGLTRETVVGAACAVADANGLEAVTVARVAARLGVRSPSIYNHVAGLEGLRVGIAAAALGDLHDRLRDAAVGRAGKDALLAVADAYRAYALAHPGCYPTLQQAPGDDPLQQQRAAAVVELLARLLEPWRLGDAERIHAIRALRSAMHGFVDLERTGGFGIDLPLEESYHRMVSDLAAGLGRG
jgi:AcrR family transcriptional regulator